MSGIPVAANYRISIYNLCSKEYGLRDSQWRKIEHFKQGRGSEQLLNQELYDIFTAVKDINPDITEQEKIVGASAVPDNNIHGSLWRKDRTNELKYYDGVKKQWVNVFDNKFQNYRTFWPKKRLR